MKAKLSTDHLCAMCLNDYPTCVAVGDDITFGDSPVGFDNIIECEYYEGELNESTKV